MIEHELVVENRLGLHARAAAKLVHRASGYRSRVLLRFEDGEEIDAKSILGILGRGASQGVRLTLCCDGEDETAACTAVRELFAQRFGEAE